MLVRQRTDSPWRTWGIAAPLALNRYALASVQKVLRLRCGALALDALPKSSTTKVPLA